MSECVFCEIVAGRIPSHKIWENDEFLAVLDAFPIRNGQTLVISKHHWPSYVFALPREDMLRLYAAAGEVAVRLDKALNAARTCQVMEGLGVDHAHIKLYPIRDTESEGGLVAVGERARDDDLERIADEIRREG